MSFLAELGPSEYSVFTSVGISTVLLGTVDAALGQVAFNRCYHYCAEYHDLGLCCCCSCFPLCAPTEMPWDSSGSKANLLYFWKSAEEGIFSLIIHPIRFRRTCARYLVLHSFRQTFFPLLILSYLHYHILFSIVLKHESIREYAVVQTSAY